MYETASTPEFKVKVNPGENQPVIVSSGVTKKNVELISDDISFIKTGRNLMVNRSEKPWQKKGFWSSLWITFLLFIICVIVRLYHEKVLSDPVLMRRRGALPKAYKEISRLESSIENLSVREFYSGLSKIVINFIGDRLNLAGAGLTVDEIKNILEKTNIQNSLIKDTIEILEECDLMAFSSMNRSRDIKNANIKKCRGLVSDLSDLAFSGQDAPAGSQGSKSGKNRFFILFVLAFMFFIFLTGLFTGPAFASRAEMFFEQANRLYKEKKFEDALKAYAKIIRDEKTENETVYFNMGNCAFRLNQLGRARFFYEKALQFKPDDRDVNKNLTYLMLKLEDKIEAEKKSFLETLMESWTGLFSHAFLSNVLLTLIHLFLIVLSIRVFTRTRKNRRRIFVSAFLILLFIFTAAVTLAGKVHIERTDNFGIVTVERLSVHAEPELSSKIKFSLHQGAKIRIEAMQGLWYRISLPNGFFGWVEKARVDKL
jgi:tetratricopeptide (TPR) repeat protein